MFKFFNNLAYKITKENWGFPWHIILAVLAAYIVHKLLLLADYGFLGLQLAVVFLAVNIIGLINEKIQKSKRRDFWQDMIGNNIGIAIYFLIVLF